MLAAQMFHPNVYSGHGEICMDTLQDRWSPCHNICSVLMSIQSMLTDPNCASPANPEAALLYQKDRTSYNRCAGMRLLSMLLLGGVG